jgi:hypothetical protein
MALTAADKALLLFVARNAVFSSSQGLAALIMAVQNEPVQPVPANAQAATVLPAQNTGA